MFPLTKLSVLIAHHAPLMRLGLKSLIQSQPQFYVIRETGDATVARRIFTEEMPDLVLLSLTLQHGDGFSLLREFRKLHPGVATLVVSARQDSLSVQRAFKAGAHGYVALGDEPAEVLAAINRILAGNLHASASVSQGLLQMLANGSIATRGNQCDALSDRELQIFRLVGSGLGTSRIAQELHLSVKTVETHRQRIKQKLRLTNGAELTRRATAWLLDSAPSLAREKRMGRPGPSLSQGSRQTRCR